MRWVVWIILLFSTTVHAAWWQYETATGQVIGVFATEADSRPKAGTALIDVGATTLPIPLGCTVGRKEWTLLSPGNVLPPVVNPTLVFFRCHVVANKRDVYSAVNAEIAMAASQYMGDGNDKTMLLLAEMYRRCPIGDNSANCPEIRTGADKIAELLRSKTQLRTLAEFGATAKIDGDALIAAKGW